MDIRIKKVGRIVLFCCVFMCSIADTKNIVLLQENCVETQTDVLMGTKIVWQYKTIDGILYKRGYNEATRKRVTDWIRA